MMAPRNNYTGMPGMNQPADLPPVRDSSIGSALEWTVAGAGFPAPAVALFTPHDPACYRNHAEEIEAVRKEAGK